MKPLDLSKFKKISSSNSHSVFSHPDGHFIKVAHKNMPVEEVNKLQRLAEGGTVGGVDKDEADKFGKALGTKDDEPKEQPKPSPTPQQSYADGGDVKEIPLSGNFTMPENSHLPIKLEDKPSKEKLPSAGDFRPLQDRLTDPQTASQAPSSQEPSLTPPSSQLNQAQPAPGGQNPLQAQAQSQLAIEGMGMQAGLQGIQQQQQAGEQAAQAERQAARQQMALGQKQAQDYQDHLANINKDHYQFQQDLMNGQIDANRYVKNMSTGSKVLTGLGLILGGLSSGLTGKSNPALDFLQKNIDRDIDAQRAELGKKENLLSANLRQYGNLATAADVTRMQTANIIAAKLTEGLAQAKSTQAKASAATAASELLSRYANVIPQAAARQALFQSQGHMSIAPEQVAEAIVPEKEKPEVKKSLGAIQQVESLRQDLHKANDKLQGMVGRGILSPNQRSALINNYAGKLAKISAGRYNETEARNQIESMLYGKTDFSQDTRSLKDQNIDSFFDTERAPHDSIIAPFKPYGVNIPATRKQQAFTNTLKR